LVAEEVAEVVDLLIAFHVLFQMALAVLVVVVAAVVVVK
jgi:hypothetical protein